MMAIPLALLELVALSASCYEAMVNGCAAASEEKKFDLSEAVARFGDIMNRDGPVVEIGPRSVFANSGGGVWQQPAEKGAAHDLTPLVGREAWSGRTVASGMRTVASGQ